MTLYPVYVWKEQGTCYGATIPDIFGLNFSVDRLEDLQYMAQKAIVLLYDGSPDVPPLPSSIETLQGNPHYNSGFWVMVNVDLMAISTQTVRIRAHIPQAVLHRIDAAANAMKISRSRYLTLASLRKLTEPQ